VGRYDVKSRLKRFNSQKVTQLKQLFSLVGSASLLLHAYATYESGSFQVSRHSVHLWITVLWIINMKSHHSSIH